MDQAVSGKVKAKVQKRARECRNYSRGKIRQKLYQKEDTAEVIAEGRYGRNNTRGKIRQKL